MKVLTSIDEGFTLTSCFMSSNFSLGDQNPITHFFKRLFSSKTVLQRGGRQ